MIRHSHWIFKSSFDVSLGITQLMSLAQQVAPSKHKVCLLGQLLVVKTLSDVDGGTGRDN